MSAEPLVSVVLPTYNRAHSLARAVRSVLAQSHRNLEVIVVDDGSTDGTVALVQKLAAADSRVRLVQQPNRGPAAARNAGVREARGELVAFQDSDDEWLTEKLEHQLAVLRRAPEASMCVCSYLVYRTTGNVRAYFLGQPNMLSPQDVRRQVLVNFFFPTPSWLVRRAALETAGPFDESMRCWEDWELAIRLGKVGPITLIDEALYVQNVSEGSVNRQDSAYGPSLKRILEKHAHLWNAEPQILAEHLYVLGRHEIRYGSIEEARRCFRRATQLAPRFGKAWRALWISALGKNLFSTIHNFAAALRGRFGPRPYEPQPSKVMDYIEQIHGHELTKSQRRPSDA